MNTLKYKGFIGSVGYSDDDHLFFGKIIGINSLVNFEGTTADELANSFHSAVDHYITLCKEENRQRSSADKG